MPLTFLAGIYGMNFKFMPELQWPWAYPLVLGIMASIAGGMLLFMRRRKWL
jgi:magnesium transporter